MSYYCKYIMPFFMDRVTENLKIPRQEILSSLTGHVLEIGIGTGANLGKYPTAVNRVTGIEPDPGSLNRCRVKWMAFSDQPYQLDLVLAGAENLPFEDSSFDSILSSLVFCSIQDPDKAASEVFRVLKPGGSFIFFEHILDPSQKVARWQKRLNPVWRRISCGCHMNRTTENNFRNAGFSFSEFESYYHTSMGPLFSAVIRGIAIKDE